ncbi:MAG: hypothetical protein R3F03_10145 [Opitutaceae bacterium]
MRQFLLIIGALISVFGFATAAIKAGSNETEMIKDRSSGIVSPLTRPNTDANIAIVSVGLGCGILGILMIAIGAKKRS